MSTVTNLAKSSGGGALFDIAQFDISTFNAWVNATKSSSVITNLSKSNQGGAFFDISQFDIATFNNWSNLVKS